jgi:hypothetical protein
MILGEDCEAHTAPSFGIFILYSPRIKAAATISQGHLTKSPLLTPTPLDHPAVVGWLW